MLSAAPVLSAVPVPSTFPAMLAVSSNRGAAYDIVLLAHVLSALVGFGAVGVAGVYALLVRRPGPPSESVRRYYRPGVNWAGRILFVVPILGITLMAMSHGSWSFADTWIGIGLVLWATAAMVAEMVLWPAERALQVAVTSAAATSDGSISDGSISDGSISDGSISDGSASDDPALGGSASDDPVSGSPIGIEAHRALCLRIAGVSAGLVVIFLVCMVVMTAKP